MGVKVATVAASISNLSVSGVAIKDIHEIPEEITGRLCPVLFPDPAGFVTGITITRESYGLDADAKKDVRYTLNYVYLHCEDGAVRYIADAVDAMVDKVVLILNAIADNSSVSGSVDIVPSMSGEFGQVEDPAGNMFFGCKISVAVQEFYEVS